MLLEVQLLSPQFGHASEGWWNLNPVSFREGQFSHGPRLQHPSQYARARRRNIWINTHSQLSKPCFRKCEHPNNLVYSKKVSTFLNTVLQLLLWPTEYILNYVFSTHRSCKLIADCRLNRFIIWTTSGKLIQLTEKTSMLLFELCETLEFPSVLHAASCFTPQSPSVTKEQVHSY